MNKYTKIDKMIKDIKKGKARKGEAIILDESSNLERDKFEVTGGNLLVLKSIPDMMKEDKWRDILRGLVLEYTFTKNKKNKLIW